MSTFYYLNQYISKTLNGSIDASQTTGIILSNSTGIDTTKPGIICVDWADPLNTATAEWITYTSIDGSSELQGVVRGAEGFSAKTHDNGAVIAFPLSESHVNNLATALTTLEGYTDSAIEFVIDGGGAVITTGIKSGLEVPYDCDIVAATLVSVDNTSGSIVVNVWKKAYADLPGTVADKITASAPPTITTSTKATDTTLTGWTKSLSKGDWLYVNVDSCTSIKLATLSLKVIRV